MLKSKENIFIGPTQSIFANHAASGVGHGLHIECHKTGSNFRNFSPAWAWSRVNIEHAKTT